MHNPITTGIPVLAILLGRLSNRNDVRRLEDQMDAKFERMEREIRELRSETRAVRSEMIARFSAVDARFNALGAELLSLPRHHR